MASLSRLARRIVQASIACTSASTPVAAVRCAGSPTVSLGIEQRQVRAQLVAPRPHLLVLAVGEDRDPRGLRTGARRRGNADLLQPVRRQRILRQLIVIRRLVGARDRRRELRDIHGRPAAHPHHASGIERARLGRRPIHLGAQGIAAHVGEQPDLVARLLQDALDPLGDLRQARDRPPAARWRRRPRCPSRRRRASRRGRRRTPAGSSGSGKSWEWS